ncbi:unnamed protein product [Meloidogyne enterolobii]|uniref:Uncharacterized protein n=1 Tax=Meloidogyne enterolobii TaxID=390850 RepID=A0ACB0Y5J7_MELEN
MSYHLLIFHQGTSDRTVTYYRQYFSVFWLYFVIMGILLVFSIGMTVLNEIPITTRH